MNCRYELRGERYVCAKCGDTRKQIVRRNCKKNIVEVKAKIDTWQVGLVTAPRYPSTIEKTLVSIQESGFDAPTIFSDGQPNLPEGYQTVVRSRASGSWPNWYLALTELCLRGLADAYAIFEDDVLLAKGCREYLESIEIPQDAAFLSLYTPYGYESSGGFAPLDVGEKTVGALAWVFPRKSAEMLVSSGFGLERMRAHGANQKDNAVGLWAKRNGLKMYWHTPSLAQHIGETSTIHSGLSATDTVPHSRTAPSFVGEQFDASRLPAKIRRFGPAKNSLGIVGFNTAQGLGYLNRDMAKFLGAARWLIPRHSRFPQLQDIAGVDSVSCSPGASEELIREFCEGLDTVIFTETIVIQRLPKVAKDCGLKLICVPMHEWLPESEGWMDLVDLWIAPTKFTEQQLLKRSLPGRIACQLWPVDASRIPYRKRTKCERFVFIHGNGGPLDRKGGSIVSQAAALFPEAPIIVYSQQPTHRASNGVLVDWPKHVEFRGAAKEPSELYRDGDVLLCPSRWEGLGLQHIEAQVAGMPIITTDAPPMNEHNHWQALRAIPEDAMLSHKFTSWVVQPECLADAMKECLGKDISGESDKAREYGLSRSWERNVEAINSLLW